MKGYFPENKTLDVQKRNENFIEIYLTQFRKIDDTNINRKIVKYKLNKNKLDDVVVEELISQDINAIITHRDYEEGMSLLQSKNHTFFWDNYYRRNPVSLNLIDYNHLEDSFKTREIANLFQRLSGEIYHGLDEVFIVESDTLISVTQINSYFDKKLDLQKTDFSGVNHYSGFGKKLYTTSGYLKPFSDTKKQEILVVSEDSIKTFTYSGKEKRTKQFDILQNRRFTCLWKYNNRFYLPNWEKTNENQKIGSYYEYKDNMFILLTEFESNSETEYFNLHESNILKGESDNSIKVYNFTSKRKKWLNGVELDKRFLGTRMLHNSTLLN